MTTPVTSLPMQKLLGQMQEMSDAAAGKKTPVDLQVSGSFGAALRESLQRINSLQNASTATAQAFQSGDPGVELHEVMIAGQKASIAFEMGVQVRNRLLNAYKDIMNMQV
ncbi:flagellar hook-basal body complex protein FliE [Microbulbifer harenosus]|uniref:Flagellar hook-basal body complex protein FliE n=1 Tax=Microbulbifer harenosus TaxID=2576840 RepID=A0ABY2UMY9_9GAMM|nr:MULTISPECIES: flagellar hook-basal body complex protein FliE [Microbulbifer]QIL89885.1 flagellar hook-basal body complex protein FliE [Microbulbifer sp. SH-1]TLM79981.1 flagellar hook-basal body complex protein FliE [Microbulbifer harenosus]